MSSVDTKIITILQRHFQSTLEMLTYVIDNCPDNVWDIPDEPAPVWQQLYHCLIGVDGWIRDPETPFEPQPFHTDAAGMLKGRTEPALSREQIAGYRDRVCAQVEQLFSDLTLEALVQDVDTGGCQLSLADHMLDQIRHLQHHLGSMHSQLRRRTGTHPEWVSYTERAYLAAQNDQE